MEEITTSNKLKIIEGDYQITDSFKDKYTIHSSKMIKIFEAIANPKVDFIMVNESVINKRYIFKIEPVKKEPKEPSIDERLKQTEKYFTS